MRNTRSGIGNGPPPSGGMSWRSTIGGFTSKIPRKPEPCIILAVVTNFLPPWTQPLVCQGLEKFGAKCRLYNGFGSPAIARGASGTARIPLAIGPKTGIRYTSLQPSVPRRRPCTWYGMFADRQIRGARYCSRGISRRSGTWLAFNEPTNQRTNEPTGAVSTTAWLVCE